MGNNRNHLTSLSNWLAPVAKGIYSLWKRCWRASVDGWAASTFHSRCDGKGPTVTIIRVGKYIFGGYTSISWGKLLLLREPDPGVKIVERGLRMVGSNLRGGNAKRKNENIIKMALPLDARIETTLFTFVRSCSHHPPPPPPPPPSPLILPYHHHFLNLRTILII